VIEAVDPITIVPISMSNTYKVFDGPYMLWICIWMCPYHITAGLADPAFGSKLEFWARVIEDRLHQHILVKDAKMDIDDS